MRRDLGVVIFGFIEFIIGGVTLTAVILSLILKESYKPPEVLIFVVTTSIISLSLGIGVLRYNLMSLNLLLFFSASIILSKILIFAKIIFLSGALETTIPSGLKNIISIIYHSLLLWYFNLPSIRRRFGERRNFWLFLKSPFAKC